MSEQSIDSTGTLRSITAACARNFCASAPETAKHSSELPMRLESKRNFSFSAASPATVSEYLSAAS